MHDISALFARPKEREGNRRRTDFFDLIRTPLEEPTEVMQRLSGSGGSVRAVYWVAGITRGSRVRRLRSGLRVASVADG
jgi:hypothetical protein